jgi:hypothetical protein
MVSEVDRSRESLKSILTCLDEFDFHQAAIEIKQLDVSVDHVIRIFLEFLVSKINERNEDAWLRLQELLELLHLEMGGKHDLDAKIIRQFCQLSVSMPRNSNDGKRDKKLDRLTESGEREKLERLICNDDYPDCEAITTSIEILINTRNIEALVASNRFSEAVREVKNMASILPQVCEYNAVQVYEMYFSKVNPYRFVTHLLSVKLIRLFCYGIFAEGLQSIPSKIKKETERVEFLEWFKSYLKRIEPRNENSFANGWLYQFMKRTFNLVVLRHYIDTGRIQEGLKWTESDTGGMDFLQIDKILHKPKEGDKWQIEWTEEKYVVLEKYFPYEVNLNNVQVHDVGYSHEPMNYDRKIRLYYSIFCIYKDIINDISADPIVRGVIADRVIAKAKEIQQWINSDDNVKWFMYPSFIADILYERKQYDDAIEFYRSSDLDEEKKVKRINECRFERDGYIYDQLKETLRLLNQSEQKQLIAYSQLFQLEIRLRNFVDETITIHHGNHKWWKNYASEDLHKKVHDRKKEYEQNPYFREAKETPRDVDFSTLPELLTFIDKQWSLFQGCFHDKKIFEGIMRIIAGIRLDVAHARLIDDKQLEKVKESCIELNKRMDVWKSSNPE